jgi:Ca-activated chloride channel homolog
MTILQAGERFGLITTEDATVPLTGVSVRGSITGRAAKVTLRQRFENREDSAIEAVYKFPLPEGGAVCGFTVATGDRVLRGRVEEREKAFAEYDEALAQGHGAFLLDEERPNIFTLSVGNVKPRHAVDIEVVYVTTLETNGSEVRFMLPTTISPRYVPADMPARDGIPVDRLVNPEVRLDVPYGLSLHLDVAGSRDIAGIECPSHAIRTSYADDAVAVEFSAETVKMDRDFVLTITYAKEFKNRGYAWSDGEHRYVQLDFTPDEQDGFRYSGMCWYLPCVRPEVIFMLDCSGSMRGSSIVQAKKALEVFLRGMPRDSRFNVYRFGSTFSTLFPQSVEYDAQSLATALRHLSTVDADLGGTELLGPLRDIYARKVTDCDRRNIVLLTDGQVGNEADILALVQSDAATRLFAVGIGHGPNEYLVRKLASLSGGAVEFVAPGERIEPRVLRLFGKVMAYPLRFTVDWPAAAEQAPLNPAVHQGECVSLLARMPAGVEVASEVTVQGGGPPIHGTWRVPVSRVDGPDAAIPLLWARAYISDLEEGVTAGSGSRQSERRGKSAESRIVALSKQYGILSRGTSFITVEYRTDAQKVGGEIELRKVPSMLTRGWGGIDARVQYAMAPQPRMAMHPSAYITDAAEVSCLRRASFEMAAPSPAMAHDSLADILSLQSAGGGFELSDSRQAGRIGLDLAELREAAARMVNGGRESFKLLCSAVVLALLEVRFPDRRDEWFAVTGKSRAWLGAEVGRLSPLVDGAPLEQWATNYARTRLP